MRGKRVIMKTITYKWLFYLNLFWFCLLTGRCRYTICASLRKLKVIINEACLPDFLTHTIFLQ